MTPESSPIPDAAAPPKPWYRRAWLYYLVFLIAVIRAAMLVQGHVTDDPHLLNDIGGWLHLLLPVSFIIILWRPPPPGQTDRPIFRRLIHCALLGWFIQVVIRSFIAGPAQLLIAIQNHSHADGVAVNLAALLFGWLTALILALPFALVASLLDKCAPLKGQQREHEATGMKGKGPS